MSTLVTTSRNQLTKTLTGGSLAALVKAKQAERTTFLLLDCSYSMTQPAGGTRDYYSGGQSKMDALRNIVGQLHRDGVNPIMVGFGLTPDPGPHAVGFVEYVPDAIGSTPLKEAIEFAHRHGAGHLIVISDGEPDDPIGATYAAEKFNGLIDVFYCGSRPSHGEQFLQSLAQATGGKCQSVSLSQQKQLTDSLKGLLNA